MYLDVRFDQFQIDEHLMLEVFTRVIRELTLGYPTKPKGAVVVHHEGDPMCSRNDDQLTCTIYLSSDDTTGLQLAYQFAHEVCHGLIFGSLSGELSGLFWLEETVCELASFHCLSALRDEWSHIAPDYPIEHVDKYIRDALAKGQPPAQLPLREYIELHRAELYAPKYHRDLYSQMALALYPFFRVCPRLWWMLPYFGDLKAHDRIDHWLEDMGRRTPPELQPLVQAWGELLLGPPQLHSQK